MSNVSTVHDEVLRIPIAKIRETVLLRAVYDPETLLELAASLKEVGLLQPILVRRGADGTFDLIAGSRRLRAEKQSGKSDILAIIVSKIDDRKALIMALAENMHRDNLTPFEEASLFLRLARDHNMTEQEIAGSIKKGLSYVRQRMMLMKLPKEVQMLVSKGQISLAQVDVLQRLPTAEQVRIGTVVARNQLSPDDARQLLHQDGTRASPPSSTQQRYVRAFFPLKLVLRVQRAAKFFTHLRDEIERFNPDDCNALRDALTGMQETIRGILRAIDKEERGGGNGRGK